MQELDWRMAVYDLPLDENTVSLPDGATRFFYVREGTAVVRSGGNATELAADDGVISVGRADLHGSGMVWVYEAGPHRMAFIDAASASLVLARRVQLGPPGPILFRADRIESPAGSATPRHGHRGPGLRRLLYGRLMGEIGDGHERIDPGHAWFETGKDPVIGTNIHTGTSAFVRAMLLPPELYGGGTSFVAADPTEAAKPRAVTNRIFGEMIIQL